MAVLKVTLPAGVVPVDGLQVSFRAPCACATFSHIQIDNRVFALVDAAGADMTQRSGTWVPGAMLSIILDVTNQAAYLQNAAVERPVYNFVSIEDPYFVSARYVGSAILVTDTDVSHRAGSSGVNVDVFDINVYENTFMSGESFEVLNITDNVPVRVHFIGKKAFSTNFEAPYKTAGANSVDIAGNYGAAKFIRMPGNAGWLVSGDVKAAT